MELIIAVVVFIFIFAACSIKIVNQAQKGVVERLGTFNRLTEPGVNFVIPFFEKEVRRIDLREHVKDFPPQPVITKDNVAMQIDTVVYYKVTDPVKFIYEISNPIAAIENLTATTLRNLIGELVLDETLTSRDAINNKLNIVLDEATDPWGIKINRVELKNIIPPRDIQDAMERQMRAERQKRESILIAEGEKQSKILQAEGEKESQILKAAADKEAQILQAQGEAEAIKLRAEAKASGVKSVLTSIKEADPTKEVLAYKSFESLEKIAESPASKLVLPNDAINFLGGVNAAKEIWKA
ncbi:MAG: SPFH/Band 7/PHB domain protein [Clostridia bacterium]|nr:SPFH/Band 7/PHB domain protein [Clostridia bacterium]